MATDEEIEEITAKLMNARNHPVVASAEAWLDAQPLKACPAFDENCTAALFKTEDESFIVLAVANAGLVIVAYGGMHLITRADPGSAKETQAKNYLMTLASMMTDTSEAKIIDNTNPN